MRDVVVAVVVHRGPPPRILLTQRSPLGSFPWAWELPGGKVERGEDARAALVRELQEELGVLIVDVGREVADWRVRPTAQSAGLRFRAYEVAVETLAAALSAYPLVAIGIGWYRAEELDSLVMTPGNRAILSRLRAFLEEA